MAGECAAPSCASTMPTPISRSRSRSAPGRAPSRLGSAKTSSCTFGYKVFSRRFTEAGASFRHRLAARTLFLAQDLDAHDELAGEVRVELRARAALDLGDGDLVRQGAAVGAIARHGVVGIGNRDDAGDERNRVACKPQGIAAPIPTLVVQVHARDERV